MAVTQPTVTPVQIPSSSSSSPGEVSFTDNELVGGTEIYNGVSNGVTSSSTGTEIDNGRDGGGGSVSNGVTNLSTVTEIDNSRDDASVAGGSVSNGVANFSSLTEIDNDRDGVGSSVSNGVTNSSGASVLLCCSDSINLIIQIFNTSYSYGK